MAVPDYREPDPNRSIVLSGPCHECGERALHAIDCPLNLERAPREAHLVEAEQ